MVLPDKKRQGNYRALPKSSTRHLKIMHGVYK
jgi:hypothetical protein